ncbi:MAG: NYN domain-containing protein [Acidobacteria bacterium]|nr:NYN domain-containing protein [Acidobacteriota bacterium]
MSIVAVFLDGGYIEKLLKLDHQQASIDFGKLAQEMAAPDELLRAYYYHCLPYQSNPPTEEEKQRYAARHRFITALKFLPRFEVRLGRLAYRGIGLDGKPIFQQKRVDCMLGVDMALLAGKGKITNVALFTGDSDFIPAVEAAKRESVLITLWHGSLTSEETKPSRELFEIADERIEFTTDHVRKILRPQKPSPRK